MAVARLAGDALAARYSARSVLVAGVGLATAACATVLAAGDPVVAVVGLVLVGGGVANAVPLLFSAAGRIPPTGPSLAAVFTVGYLGFIAGPPVIGVLADAATSRRARRRLRRASARRRAGRTGCERTRAVSKPLARVVRPGSE